MMEWSMGNGVVHGNGFVYGCWEVAAVTVGQWVTGQHHGSTPQFKRD